ncbi:MAG: hypothetical protein HON70_43965, partial [Lentisphaerae bacterium]|nr:hypothetical protein [Lentisphaerota bacterium]
FTRKHFPWENNDLGITDEVIPPFTPIEVEGKRVSTVLRTHTLNDTGLLDSIVSEGKTVLAAPMHFDVVVDGAQHEVSPRPVVFTQTKSNAVKHTTTWHAGPLVVALDGVWDYDGLLKCEMHLDLPETSTLDKLDLVIPVKPEIAKYLHVASDRMRLSVHKRLPTSSSGSEPVWQSNTVAHNDMPDSDDVVGRLPGTFVPYVWLGNERQGICWVADNDSGWLVDDVQSTHAVYRQEDSVLLRVSFVTKPGPLKARRRIVFGLQATPAKPMPRRPDHWRRMVFSLASKEFSSLCNLTIFGSAFQWGGPDFYAMYPRGKDFGIYSTIKNTRATGRLDRAVLDDWLKGYDETNPYLDIIKRNIGKVHSCKSKPDVVIPYTDVRGASVTEEAFDTFQDEWLIYEFGKRTWPTFTDPALGYVISTTPSRQDYILHYFKRMLDAGAFDAIYFDCPYPKAVRNTVTSGAYIDEHGRKRASADIFEMRELFKRCAVLAHQKRGYNMNIAHMSTVNVVPLLSWFGVNLDWEFNYGQDDFQDRGFSRDYTRIVTIGQQTGTTPLVLGSLGIRGQDPATLARARRTLAGCLLAHEVKDWAVAWGKDRTYKDALKILYDFGYGTNATVYNDWSDGFPAAISGTETAILLLVRDGEALLVVTDYGNGGTCELTLDATNVTLLPGGAFYNALSGERLQAAGASSCRFSLPKHDFRIIHYR